jgi:hypothetical protein
MKVDYNMDNVAGATAQQMKVASVQEAMEKGMALSEGEWDGGTAAWDCLEDDQDLNGEHIVLVEVE